MRFSSVSTFLALAAATGAVDATFNPSRNIVQLNNGRQLQNGWFHGLSFRGGSTGKMVPTDNALLSGCDTVDEGIFHISFPDKTYILLVFHKFVSCR